MIMMIMMMMMMMMMMMDDDMVCHRIPSPPDMGAGASAVAEQEQLVAFRAVKEVSQQLN